MVIELFGAASQAIKSARNGSKGAVNSFGSGYNGAEYDDFIRKSVTGRATVNQFNPRLNMNLGFFGNKNKGAGKINLNQKPSVSNDKLKNIVDDLYKGQGGPNTIGNGTTMDAVRNELKTRLPTNGKFHTQKLNDYLNALKRRLRAGDLNQYDTDVVNTLIEDITKALNGK